MMSKDFAIVLPCEHHGQRTRQPQRRAPLLAAADISLTLYRAEASSKTLAGTRGD